MNDPTAEQSLASAVDLLTPRADAVFARRPLLDPHLPHTADLDLLAVGEVEDFLPERLAGASRRPVDVVWVPRGKLRDAESLARLGLIAHRIVGSDVVHDRTGEATRQRANVEASFHDAEIRRGRIEGFLDMGFYTVQEIGVTRDFPELALFWIHMAYAACIAAIVDGAGRLCPNVYTRPFDHITDAGAELSTPLEPQMVAALRLDDDPRSLMPRLRRIHEVVTERFPEPAWPPCMREMTRYEYRYFGAREELEWRIGVAGEMARRGFGPAAVFYLRFWAYALARIPMVHQRASDGVDVSFVRPSRAVRPELERLCPEILADLSGILGGPARLTARDAEDRLDGLYGLRDATLARLASRGLRFRDLKVWRPYEPPPPNVNTETGGSHGQPRHVV